MHRKLKRKYDSFGRNSGYLLKSVGSGGSETTIQETGIGYDTAGRIDSIWDGQDSDPVSMFSYSYLANSGSLISAFQGPVHTVENQWAPHRNVLLQKTNKAGATVVSQFEYGVNNIGQRTSIVEEGYGFANTSVKLYGYDAMGQVLTANQYAGGTPASPGSAVVGGQFSFEYDKIGNRLESANGVDTVEYEPNALNQYDNAGGVEYAYDDDGNLLNDGTRTYTWDAENRLVKVVLGSVEAVYAYDATGRRISKVVKENSAEVQRTAFVFDRWNLVEEADLLESGATAKKHLWGLDLSSTLQRAGGVGGLLKSSAISSGAWNDAFAIYDGGGNVSELLDDTGTVAAHYEYGPFGESLRVTGTLAKVNPFRFSTKYEDDETGLLYYGCRYYTPNTGRWLIRDPIEEQGGANVYAFVLNRPINKCDIIGLLTSVDEDVLTHATSREISMGIPVPPLASLTIRSSRIELSSSMPEIYNVLEQEAKRLCPCKTYARVERTIEVQTIHLFSLGHIGVKITGNIHGKSKGKSVFWQFNGIADPQDERFDFEPLLNKRGWAGEILNFGGEIGHVLGFFDYFMIRFTGPVKIPAIGIVKCSEL